MNMSIVFENIALYTHATTWKGMIYHIEASMNCGDDHLTELAAHGFVEY